MRVGIPLELIYSTCSTLPISTTNKILILGSSLCNHCIYHLKMHMRKVSALRTRCTIEACQSEVSNVPLHLLSIPSLSYMYSFYPSRPGGAKSAALSCWFRMTFVEDGMAC